MTDTFIGSPYIARAIEHGRACECAAGTDLAILGGHKEVVQVRQFGPVLLAVAHTDRDLSAIAVESRKRAAAQGVAYHAGQGGGIYADGVGTVAIDDKC